MPEKFTPMGGLPAPKLDKPPRGRGRPTTYQPEYCTMVLEAGDIWEGGATDQVIADFLGVDRGSIRRWRDDHPEFAEACAQVKDAADDIVEASLFQRARGYEHDAVKIFLHEGKPVTVDYTERYAPDTAAAMNWLKNRRPDRWRERVEHTGKDGGPIEVKSGDALEAARLIAFALEEAKRLVQQPGDGAKVIEGESKE